MTQRKAIKKEIKNCYLCGKPLKGHDVDYQVEEDGEIKLASHIHCAEKEKQNKEHNIK